MKISLGYPDSNQERQDQNLQCYHYTIPQTLGVNKRTSLEYGCKITAFSENCQIKPLFFANSLQFKAEKQEDNLYIRAKKFGHALTKASAWPNRIFKE